MYKKILIKIPNKTFRKIIQETQEKTLANKNNKRVTYTEVINSILEKNYFNRSLKK